MLYVKIALLLFDCLIYSLQLFYTAFIQLLYSFYTAFNPHKFITFSQKLILPREKFNAFISSYHGLG